MSSACEYALNVCKYLTLKSNQTWTNQSFSEPQKLSALLFEVLSAEPKVIVIVFRLLIQRGAILSAKAIMLVSSPKCSSTGSHYGSKKWP